MSRVQLALNVGDLDARPELTVGGEAYPVAIPAERFGEPLSR